MQDPRRVDYQIVHIFGTVMHKRFLSVPKDQLFHAIKNMVDPCGKHLHGIYLVSSDEFMFYLCHAPATEHLFIMTKVLVIQLDTILRTSTT